MVFLRLAHVMRHVFPDFKHFDEADASSGQAQGNQNDRGSQVFKELGMQDDCMLLVIQRGGIMRHIPVDQAVDLGGVCRVIGVDGKLGLRGDQNTLFVVFSAASEALVLSLGKTAVLPIISAW